MKTFFISFILIIMPCVFFAQKGIYIDVKSPAYNFWEEKGEKVDSLKQLPSKIQRIIKQLFDHSMTDFVGNISFVTGTIVDIESYVERNPNFQVEYCVVVPKYGLLFQLRDTTINIKNYYFQVCLDQYGQILQFDWPRSGYEKRNFFIKGYALQETAAKYALKKGYKVKQYECDLGTDPTNQKLCWKFHFLQKSTGDSLNYDKEFHSVYIDAISKEIIYERTTIGQGRSESVRTSNVENK